VTREDAPHPARSALLHYAVVAAVCALLLAIIVPFGPFSLRIPFDYRGDAVIFAVFVKGVAEDGPLHFSRIGAPFGSDVVDWPLGMWLPFLATTAVVRATGEPGLALNLLWLGATVLTAVTAAWAFGRLGHPRGVAFAFALAYAFLPYGFYRNVDHPNLVFPLVPLLALTCLRACGSAPAPRADERRITLAACAAQGLCFIYYSFFAAWLLVVGTAIGWLRTRRRDLLRSGALGLALLVLGAAIPLVPSAVYWSRNGRNEKLQYKVVADADHYGLKLRQMLMPIDEHPLPALRRVAARVRQAAFPDENENASARLGTLGAIGLVCLLGFAGARAAGLLAADDALGPAAALTAASLLLAQVGGLGSLFNVLVAPDIRGYNRIVVFVAFFALHATAVLVSRLLERLPAVFRTPKLRNVVLVLIGTAALGDQVPRTFLANTRWASAPAFDEDAAFVSQLESRLPAGAMVFQLPHATIPVDLTSSAPMEIYDPGRAYLHSRTLRWSWGSLLGRTDDWQTQASKLSPVAMARRLALAGFEGIWVDRWGYPENGALPWPALETALAAATDDAPVVSSGGRYSFLRLAALRGRLASELGSGAFQSAKTDALAGAALLPRWREGCSDEQGDIREPSRVCGASAWAVLKNDAPHERRLVLSARLRALRPGRLRLRGEGFEDDVVLAGETLTYRRELTIGPGRRLRLDMAFDGPCEATSPRPRCVEIIDMEALPAQASATGPP
jgi:phosphoglycerol transferase